MWKKKKNSSANCSFLWLYVPPFHNFPEHLTLKSMQRAASSDTLSTMAFSDTRTQCDDSAPLHDVKQQLNHSQSMILPDNKVFASRAHAPHKLIKCFDREKEETEIPVNK